MTDNANERKSQPIVPMYRSITQQFDSNSRLQLKQELLNRRSQLIEDGEVEEEPQLVDPLAAGVKNYSFIKDNVSASAMSTAETQVAWSDAGYTPK